jgi:hypothetical protein
VRQLARWSLQCSFGSRPFANGGYERSQSLHGGYGAVERPVGHGYHRLALGTGIRQYLVLWERLQDTTLVDSSPDKFMWKWTSSSCYSASSVYRAFFVGKTSILDTKELSKVSVPQVGKFFVWLVLLGRCWTLERLQRHSLPKSGVCMLCAQCDESN